MCRPGHGCHPGLPRQWPREEDKKLPILSFQSKQVTCNKDKLGLYPDSAPLARMEYTFIFPSPRPNGSSSIHVERHRVTCIALQNSSGQTGYKHRVKLLLLFCECWSLLQRDECQMGAAEDWAMETGMDWVGEEKLTGIISWWLHPPPRVLLQQ